MLKSDSLKNLAAALVQAQKKMGVALKDSKNPFFKSKYADLNAIIDAAIPALNEAGIAVLQTPQMIPGDYNGAMVPVIQTVLLHESGEYIAGNSQIVAAKANDPQAAGSATTYARRYGLQAMVTLKAEDDDGEAAMGRNSKPEQKPAPAKAQPTPTPEKVVATALDEANKVVEAAVPAKPAGKFARPKKTETKTTNDGGDLY